MQAASCYSPGVAKKRVPAPDVLPNGRAHLPLSTVTLLAALAFAVFFQVSKQPPFRDINPFGVDPYDAVGSIAVQATLVFALLSFARSVRLRMDGVRNETSPRLVLRGERLAVVAILVTLITDCIAVLVNPVPRSRWGDLLLGQLAALVLVVCGLLIWLAFVTARTPTVPVPSTLTPADAIDDLWSLVRALAGLALGSSRRQRPVDRFSSDRLFARLPWIDPRRHPWRFTTLVGVLAGVLAWLGHLREGRPPSPSAGLQVAAVFLGVETATALAALAIVGGYLGLRPSFVRNVTRPLP